MSKHADPDSGEINDTGNLLDLTDRLNEVSYLLEAAFMAASDLTVEYQTAMKAVIGCAAEKLEAALDDLEAVRPKQKEIAETTDPIFAAIERHRVVRDAFRELLPRADEVAATLEGREVAKADKDAVEALALAEAAAFLELFVIVPTTIEGRRALLQYLVQRDEDGISEPIGEIAAKLLRLPMFGA